MAVKNISAWWGRPSQMSRAALFMCRKNMCKARRERRR